MTKSVRLSKTIMEKVEAEARRSHRSASGQVEYWLELGAKLEQVPGFNRRFLKKLELLAANESELRVTQEELDHLLDDIVSRVPEQYGQVFDQQKAAGIGVGLDQHNELVYAQKPE